jgi:hypothetical protein
MLVDVALIVSPAEYSSPAGHGLVLTLQSVSAEADPAPTVAIATSATSTASTE